MEKEINLLNLYDLRKVRELPEAFHTGVFTFKDHKNPVAHTTNAELLRAVEESSDLNNPYAFGGTDVMTKVTNWIFHNFKGKFYIEQLGQPWTSTLVQNTGIKVRVGFEDPQELFLFGLYAK